MSAEIIRFVFSHDDEDTPIRGLTIEGDPWFIQADVCRGLGLANPRQVLQRLREHQKGVHLVDTPGGPQQMSIISESGLLILAMRSDKERARHFQDWLAEDVLPTLRRTGRYELATPQEPQPCHSQLLVALNGAVVTGFANVNAQLNELRGLVQDKWHPFSKETERYVCEGVAKYEDCECIFCRLAEIVGKYGQPLGSCRLHHANGNRRDFRRENCAPSCADCHERIHNPNRPDHIPAHEAQAIAFAFHQRLAKKAGKIHPPKTHATLWDFRPLTQADMGFPPSPKKRSAS